LDKETTDKYVDKVVKRYYKLFGLPTQRKLTIYLAILAVHGAVLSMLPLNLSLETFAVGLCFGAVSSFSPFYQTSSSFTLQ
jgi:uncharacterized membrane protein YbaN (DUF454 family)